MKTLIRIGAAAIALAVIGGCTPTGETSPSTPRVVVSSYPLEFLVTEIGGDLIDVHNVVPAGAEPHDVELSPSHVTMMEQARLMVFVGGFQPAIDAATAELATAVDLAPGLALQVRDGALDPHFWLDPGRMVIAAEQIEAALAESDPDNLEAYASRSETLTAQLQELDAAYRDSLSACSLDSFVTGHAAFGYLADAYDLTEISVAGIDPDTEPSPAAIAATRERISALGLPVVFAEPGDTKIAEVLAGELGIEFDILDPIEAVATGEDYMSLMQKNLEALRGGLQCR